MWYIGRMEKTSDHDIQDCRCTIKILDVDADIDVNG